MPSRTTIVLPPPLKDRAVNRARQQGVSFGEFVRQAIKQRLAGSVKKTRLNLKGKKTGDPFWDNLVVFDDGGRPDQSTRIDEIVYGNGE